MALVPGFSNDDFFGPLIRPGSLFPPVPAKEAAVRPIPIDVSEDASAFHVSADLPGVKKEDVSLTIRDDVVRIGVASKQEKEEKDEKKHYHRVERFQTWSERAVRLPQSADFDKVDAKLEDGVLRVNIPKKSKAAAEGRKVAVQ